MSGTGGEFDLQRFVDAQAPVIDRVRKELTSGHKRSHWMWFVFPQFAGLGRSAMAQRYAITSLAEARAYLAHPILGPRLKECTGLALNIANQSAESIFARPDDLKFHSSMTLFAHVAPPESLFAAALEKFFASQRDSATMRLLD